ncbi:MAG: hypothetical protein C0404_01865 [Verrucomicrobia bacterium]|nr:hypothetical protein [Verrucomicrobiota bacterium]
MNVVLRTWLSVALPALVLLVGLGAGRGGTGVAPGEKDGKAYQQYKEMAQKLAPDDAAGNEKLAQWCQQQKLAAEAVGCWQNVVRSQPTNAQARTRLATASAAAWLSAPAGLLKNQKVPGYTNDVAWYHISVPKEYDGKTAMPLIVYLHGGAHNAGTADNVVALAQVLPPFKKAIVVFPNHLRTWWAHPREMMYLLETTDSVMLRWRVDRKRIYLMGASMGGNGVWAFGSQCPELFAAVSPISGFYADFLQFPLANLSSKPVYVLHGAKDDTVPIGGAREAYGILKKAGATIEMREADCGHQPPNDELTRAGEWLMKCSNKQTFDLTVLKERVSKLPVAGWLKKYDGN